MNNGKQYWRSLEQLADTPEFKKFVEAEFPESVDEVATDVSRRKFLGLMGASIAFAGLVSCRKPVEKIIPYVAAPENIIPGVPKYYATIMPLGMSNYGLLIENHEGRPTKIEGNPDHPSTKGATNTWLQASVLGLYDPDRSKQVRFKGAIKTWQDFVEFWRNEKARLGNGEKLAVVSRSFASPSMFKAYEDFKQQFPQARWVAYEAVSDENVLNGLKLATGQDLRPLYHYDKAKVILSLEADFLMTESENVAAHKGFSKGRRVLKAGEEMNRLYVVENHFSLTGGMADHRLRLQSQQVAAFALTLAKALQQRGLNLDLSLPAAELKVDEVWLKALTDDLLKNKGQSLIVAGSSQSPEVHALVLALNQALGNVGQTLELLPLKDALVSSTETLADLIQSMQNGEVETLVVLDANPAYDAPADLNWTQAIKKVKNVVHAGLYFDETAQQAHWHLPLSHYLEAWGDGRNADGSVSVAQPMIAPLYDSRSLLEITHLLNSGILESGYEKVRSVWKQFLPAVDFEKRWQKTLNDGYFAAKDLKLVSPKLTVNSLPAKAFRVQATSAENLELVFKPSPTVFDGRFANNGWLQELPDPVTKLTWGNGLLLSPKTAKNLNVANGDVVKLKLGEREVEIPVWIQPGHAENSATVLLGYGRSAAGKVANGVGVNASLLRTLLGFNFAVGASLSKTGKKEEMATTQDHGSMEGRPLVREATLEEYKHEPHFAEEMEEHPPLKSLWEERKYDEGYQWGMTIDLNSCSGCNACVVACQSENNIPIVGKEQVLKGREMHWIRLDRYYAGDLDDPEMVTQPMACAQCENAPCEQVCPVQATSHDAEGLNVMTYNRCIGTRYCSNNCPFKVRRFNFFNYTGGLADTLKMAMNPDVTVRSRGVMEKCTYCVQRINEVKINSKNEGRQVRDGEIKTACQQACPADAIAFGNINDPNSEVSKMKQVDRDYNLLSGLNLKTRTSYLARLRNPNPLIEKHLEKKEMEGSLVS